MTSAGVARGGGAIGGARSGRAPLLRSDCQDRDERGRSEYYTSDEHQAIRALH